MQNKSKIILLNWRTSIGILIACTVSGILVFYMGRFNGNETLSDMIKDPLWWIAASVPLSLSSLAFVYFIVTDEGLRLCWLCFAGELIRFDDMTEIGVFTGDQFSIKKYPRITYIGYNHPDGYIKYKFFPDHSKDLYEYLKDMDGLPFAYDKMDGKRRNEVCQPGKLTEYVLAGAVLVLFLPVFLFAAVLLLQEIIRGLTLNGIIRVLPVLMFSGAMIRWNLGILFAISAEFRFEEHYVYIKFPLHKEIAYGWDEFQQVCICYSYVTSLRGGPNKIIICFVKQGVKRGKISNQWPTDIGFYYKKVPFMRYSEENLEEVKKYSPHEIVDLRGTNGYHH